MEMLRKDVPEQGMLLSSRQWLHRNVSLVALYKWGSEYGNSYVRPLWWILVMVLGASALFPVTGLSHTTGAGPTTQVAIETYGSSWRTGRTVLGRLDNLFSVLGHSTVTALDTACFQRGSEYTPVYP